MKSTSDEVGSLLKNYYYDYFDYYLYKKRQQFGPVRELNPGPLAPEARIIPLDQQADTYIARFCQLILIIIQVCFVEYKYRAKRVQISHDICTRLIPPGRVKFKTLAKSEFWEKKSLDNKSLIRRFGV